MKTLMILSLSATMLISCKKTPDPAPDPEPEPTPTPAPTPTVNVIKTAAVFSAVKGDGVSLMVSFYDDNYNRIKGANYVIGANIYAYPGQGTEIVYTGSTIQASSIYSISWHVQSTKTYSFIVDTAVKAKDFPPPSGIKNLDTSSVVYKSQNFVVTNYAVTSDSVAYFLTTDGTVTRKALLGGATSCTFTPSDMAGLSLQYSNIYVLVKPINTQDVMVRGKRWRFESLSVQGKQIHFKQ